MAQWAYADLTVGKQLADLPAGQGLVVEYSAHYLGLSSVYDDSQAVNAGFAIDHFSLVPVDTAKPTTTLTLYAKLAVRDSDAYIYRVGYHVAVVGQFAKLPVVQ